MRLYERDSSLHEDDDDYVTREGAVAECRPRAYILCR